MMTRSLLLLALFALSTLAHAQEKARRAEPKPEREQGVRLRLFEIGAPLHRMARLAPDQSPNLDRTIERLELAGEEDFLADYPGQYIAILTTRVDVETKGEYRFALSSDAIATFRIAGKELLTAARENHGAVGVAKLGSGQHDVEIVLAVNDTPPRLKIEWAGPDEELARVPIESLSAEAFIFRPTNGGVKRLVAETDRPGHHQKVVGVYPSLDITTIHPPDVEVPVGGLATLADGTLVVATFDARRLKAPRPQEEPDGQLWLYHGAAGDPAKIRRELIADDLFEPAGTCVVGDSIFVSQRLEITRFDRDDESGKWIPTTIASGWESNDFHALSFGLLHEAGGEDHPGFLYMSKGTGLGLGQNPPNHGSVWRVDLSLPEGKNVEPITGGHRTPNGLGWGPKGTIFVTDNQGEFTPANELNLVRDGAFYGFEHRTGDGAAPSPFQPGPTRIDNVEAVHRAAVWLPQDEIGNSPAQPLMAPKGWPFAGQMLVCDMKYGGVNRVFLEEVDGVWQGAAFRFTQGCEGGVNRLAFGPDGSFYAGAIGGDHASTWNWVDPQGRKTYQGLQRVKPNGRVTFDIERVEATPNGFAVRFTKQVDAAWLADAANYQVQQWTYEATRNYGGPKKELEKLKVSAATPSDDGKSVALEIEGLKTGRLVHFLIDATADDGEEIWSAEAWYTLWRKPVAPGSRSNLPKHVVFVTGDNEYGSEVSMPMIASILEKQPGFRVSVLKSVNEEGLLDRHGHSIPGLRALREADVAIFFMRFRALPESQVQEIERYVASGRPIIGLRTSTHAFKYPDGPYQRLNDGFGRDVLGQKWISHYGHGTTSMATVEDEAKAHPILRGMPEEFDLRSWLYVMNRGDNRLPEDCDVLIGGRAIRGEEEEFGEYQPLAWTRELKKSGNKSQRVFYTSLGHPRDFLDVPSRRLLLNAIYWSVGMEEVIPEGGVDVPLPEGYEPEDPK